MAARRSDPTTAVPGAAARTSARRAEAARAAAIGRYLAREPRRRDHSRDGGIVEQELQELAADEAGGAGDGDDEPAHGVPVAGGVSGSGRRGGGASRFSPLSGGAAAPEGAVGVEAAGAGAGSGAGGAEVR